MLAFHICLTHVDNALHVHQCTNGGCSYSMLSGTCFGDDTSLTHSASQQYLTDGIVYLMSTGMVEVFPFQVHLTSAFL